MIYEITDRCAGCAICAKRCPAGAIAGQRRAQHHIDPSLCKECGTCWRLCPTAAILDPHGRRRVGKPLNELPRAAIDPHGCAGCRTCQLNCPFDAITFSWRRFHLLLRTGSCAVNPERCQGCAACVGGCPTGAAVIVVVAAPKQAAGGRG